MDLLTRLGTPCEKGSLSSSQPARTGGGAILIDRGALGCACGAREDSLIYFPDQLLPIYSKTHLDYWLKLFAIDSGDLGAVGRNRLLLEELKSMPAFDGWSPVEIMFFLYSWGIPDPGHKILKIAPGEDARLWSECRDSGTIRLGWDEIGDLTLI